MSRAMWSVGACVALVFVASGSAGGASRDAIVNETYQEAFCRPATSEEVRYWTSRSDWTTKGSLIELHRKFIRADRAAQNEVVRNAYRDVFQRDPAESESIHWRAEVRRGLTCADVANAHRDRLSADTPRTKTESAQDASTPRR